MTEDHKAPGEDAEVAAEEQPEPTNRAERRALKKGKGKNKVKGVVHGPSGAGFNPKDVKVSAHKEFTNRKSG